MCAYAHDYRKRPECALIRACALIRTNTVIGYCPFCLLSALILYGENFCLFLYCKNVIFLTFHVCIFLMLFVNHFHPGDQLRMIQNYEYINKNLNIFMEYEPPRGKTNNVVFDQVQHKSACTATEAG